MATGSYGSYPAWTIQAHWVTQDQVPLFLQNWEIKNKKAINPVYQFVLDQWPLCSQMIWINMFYWYFILFTS